MNYHGLAVLTAVLVVGLSFGLVLVLLLILRDNRGSFDVKYVMAFTGAVSLGMAALRWIVTQ